MPDSIFDSALLSMCMTWRHDFGLLDRKEQMAIRGELFGLYEHHVKPALDRASSAESGLAAMRQRAERAEQVSINICNIVDRLRLKFEIQRNVNFTGDVVVKEFILAREELKKALSCNNKDNDKC